MSMHSKPLARLTACLAASSLAATACGAPGGSEAPEPEEAEELFADFASSQEQGEAWEEFTSELEGKWAGETLNIVSVDDPWMPAYEEVIPAFEELTGAEINTSVFSYDATYSRELLLGDNQSSEADIFVFDMPWVGQFAGSEYVEPLDDLLEETPDELVDYDDFFQVMRDGAEWEGEIVGLPFAPYNVVNMYNTNLLDQAGVEPPRTYDDLVEVSRAVTEEVDETHGVAMNNQSGSAVGQAYFEYIYNMGGKPFESMHPDSDDYYADMTPQFTSEESLAVVELFEELLPYQPPGKLNMAWNERFNAFATGQVATISTWNYNVPEAADPETSAVVDEFEVQAPLRKDESVELNTPIGGWEMGINRFSKQKEMAWDFMLWFTSPQIGAQFASQGGFPARYSVLNNEDLMDQYPYYTVLQDIVDTAFPAFRPQIRESFEIINTLGTWIAKVLSGELEAEEAMTRADEEIGKMLDDAGYNVDLP